MKSRAVRTCGRSRRHHGSTLVEYTMILVIVSIAGILLLKAIGQTTNKLLESTNTNMPA
jgi:Flp pilus assembly pilin Flp